MAGSWERAGIRSSPPGILPPTPRLWPFARLAGRYYSEELDATYEIIGHEGRYEVHLAYERDMPIDRAGKVQSFVYALFVVNFDLTRGEPEKPVESRGTIVSP